MHGARVQASGGAHFPVAHWSPAGFLPLQLPQSKHPGPGSCPPPWADARGCCNSDLSSRHPLTALESRRGLAPAYPALHIDSVVSSDNLPPRGSGTSHHTLLAPMCPGLAPLCPLRVGLPTYSLQGTGGVPGPSRAALMSGYPPLLPATERSIYFFKLKREEIDFAFIIS